MIDKKHIGHEFPPVTLPVEEGRLKFLAKTLGITQGIYNNPDLAAAAGFEKGIDRKTEPVLSMPDLD